MSDENTISAIQAVLALNLEPSKKIEMIKSICLPSNHIIVPKNYRTKICSFYKKGNCDKGDNCEFSHMDKIQKKRKPFKETEEDDPPEFINLEINPDIDFIVRRNGYLWVIGLKNKQFPSEIRLVSFMKLAKKFSSRKGNTREKKFLEICFDLVNPKTVEIVDQNVIDQNIGDQNIT